MKHTKMKDWMCDWHRKNKLFCNINKSLVQNEQQSTFLVYCDGLPVIGINFVPLFLLIYLIVISMNKITSLSINAMLFV